METAYQSLIQHLDAEKIKYQADIDTQRVAALFSTPNGLFLLHAGGTEDDTMLHVIGHVPIKVPVGSRPSIAEAITRANYCLKLGRFEMGFKGGDLRFYVGHLISEGKLSGEVIERMIKTTLVMLNHHLPAFMSVIYGNEPPQDAIRRQEPQ
jgi:hypothetical protein